jgi:miniconductance mechanosensitive channel
VNEQVGVGFAEISPQLGGLALLALVAFVVARWGLVASIRHLVERSATVWDDALVDAKVFARLALVVPAVVAYYGIRFVAGIDDHLDHMIQQLAGALIIVAAAMSATAFLSAVNDIYSLNAEYRHRPIKGYLQVAKIAIFLLASLIVVATLLDRSPWLFLSGIGALTAVLMLIFKDTILSLVASIQISSNDMIHIGDWIEMPQAGADGDVIDVALHTVKVQNWDKTVSTIPTHKLISESFKNWRGMSESGGRRIKRAVNIDMNSIRFLSDEEVERIRGWRLMQDYIDSKTSELDRHNDGLDSRASVSIDGRRLTNIGTFREYVHSYLCAHPKIHQHGYTMLVRQLQPGPTGLPIEIYCFSNDQAWASFESIQSDILDHILAIVPEFGLRIFQEPAGADFERLDRSRAKETP